MYGKEYIEQANTDMVVGCSADVLHKFFDIADAHAAERVLKMRFAVQYVINEIMYE